MEAAQEKKENKMGTMPVNKLLINMSLPMMISMLVQAFYNIVDSIFVSRIDENALTAVSNRCGNGSGRQCAFVQIIGGKRL